MQNFGHRKNNSLSACEGDEARQDRTADPCAGGGIECLYSGAH